MRFLFAQNSESALSLQPTNAFHCCRVSYLLFLFSLLMLEEERAAMLQQQKLSPIRQARLCSVGPSPGGRFPSACPPPRSTIALGPTLPLNGGALRPITCRANLR